MAKLPIYAAEKSSYEGFLTEYSADMAPVLSSSGKTLLFYSLANKSIDARIAITTRLLDDGADPSVTVRDTNVLHTLFARPPHDATREAPVLRRLIDGGADMNLVSKRFGPPLQCLIENGPAFEAEMTPFYDVFFSPSDLNLSVSTTNAGTTLREFIFNSAWTLPLLRERVIDYERTHHGVA